MRRPTALLLTTAGLAGLLTGCRADEPSEPSIGRAPAAETAPVAPEPAAVAPAQPAAPAAPAVPAAPTAPEAPTSATPPAADTAAPPAPETPKAPEAAPAEVGTAIGNRIPSYTHDLKRADGATVKLDTHAATKPTVYIVNSTTCPYSRGYAERMKEIEAKYIAKGVDVVHVYSKREESAEDKAAYHAKTGFQGGLVIDENADFARTLEINKTPTVVLTDARGTIVYRGRIDDNMIPAKVKAHELADAIDATLAGKPVAVATTEPFG